MRKITILTFLMLFTFSTNLLFAQQHPNMFLNGSEIASIKAKIDNKEEPWLSAYNTAISRANTALNQPLLSIVDGGSNHVTNVYDGDFSSNRHDYRAVGDMSHAVRDLGIAYAFSGNDAYAKKATELIYHWCLHPEKYMKPRFKNGQSEIELPITLSAMFYGADMIWNYSGWDATEKTGFITWVKTISTQFRVPNRESPNNFGTWRLVLLATAATLIEDSDMMAYVVNHYKELIPTQIHHTGTFGQERHREEPKNGLFYSTFSLVATAQICEIVRHHGTDLYNWKASNGNGSVERGFDYLAEFVINPSSWTQRGTPNPDYKYQGENAVAYELAYSIWQKPEYLEVINKWRRPMYGNYVQGPLTLTHAFRGATLDVPESEFENNISIYPNPTSNTFVINLNVDVLKKAIIYNHLGQKVKEITTKEVNISNLSNGIYVVRITSLNNKTVTKKIIKN